MSMINPTNTKRSLLVRTASGLAVVVGLGLAGFATPAHADWRDHHDHWHHDHDWHGGYYAAPPVVYGSPYYAPPPVVYGPSVGIALPGVSIGIH